MSKTFSFHSVIWGLPYIATVSLFFRLLALRSTRAEMQAGQQASKIATLARREASASITMMALVTIYVLVHGQSAIWWVSQTIWARYWPTSPMNMVFYSLTVFTVVCPLILTILCFQILSTWFILEKEQIVTQQELDSPLMCFNFFLYLARIRAFRQGLLSIFTCRLLYLSSCVQRDQ